MKNLKALAILLAVFIFGVISCTKDEKKIETINTNTEILIPANLIKIGETYIVGAQAKAIIYAESQLFVGYNKLYIAMYDSLTNNRLTNGHFELVPEMGMGDMLHNAPVELNEDSIPATQLWQASVVFIMPGLWNLNLSFHNHKIDMEGDGVLEVSVISPTNSVLKNFISSDSSNLFISLIKPINPKIGLNDFEIAIHKKVSRMEFPAIVDYTVEIEPIMPSMGHSSPNNTNPIHIANGHYKGVVNFTMTGLWRVGITLKKNGNIIDNKQSFDINF